MKRNLVTADRYEQIALSGLVEPDDYTNEVVREPLMEHVGHLPIMAAYFHPYTEHVSEIDLGLALQMLAIHDIGETKVGDVFTYTKTEADEQEEYTAAMSLIHPSQQAVYAEFEERETVTSKFAKAMDALAPITHSMYRPMVKIENFRMKNATIQNIIDHKTKYFEWDAKLLEIFEICIEHYQLVEKGEEGIFIRKD